MHVDQASYVPNYKDSAIAVSNISVFLPTVENLELKSSPQIKHLSELKSKTAFKIKEEV